MGWGKLNIFSQGEKKADFVDYTTKGNKNTVLYYILYFNTAKKMSIIFL